MDRKEIQPPELHDSSRYYTHVVSVQGGRTLYLSGQAAFDERKGIVGGDLASQARKAFANLRVALASAGATPQDVVKITVYVVGYQASDLGAVEAGVTECFGFWRGFASTVVGVQALAAEGLRVEVEAIAVTR